MPADNDASGDDDATSRADVGVVEWLDGDRYADTEYLTMDQVATSVALGLDDLQHDDEIPEHLDIQVTADTTGPIAVLRTVIRGLTPQEDTKTSEAVLRASFELASRYNRIHLARPESCRFVHYVFAATPTGTPSAVLVGITSGALPASYVLPEPTLGTSTTDTAENTARTD